MSFRTYFPAAHREVAVSILGNVARTTDSELAKKVYAVCLRRGAPLAGSLPCRAALFCEITEGAYGSAENVLASHSLLPWVQIGMTAETARLLTLSLTDGRTRTPCPHLPVFLQCGDRTGLQCPECARLAYEQYRRSVTYCPHCFDYVSRCFEHELQLYSGEESSTLEALLIERRPGGARDNSLEYARTALSLSDERCSQSACTVIAERLKERHYVSASGRWRMAELVRDFASFFSAGFEDVRLTNLVASGGVPELCLRSAIRGRTVHPVHINLMYWFARDVESMSIRGSQRRERPNIPCAVEATIKAKRTAWQQHVQGSLGLTRTEMRDNARALWSWLYRNDRKWLAGNQVAASKPPGGRKSHAMPQPVFAKILANAQDPRYTDNGRAPLPSAYQTRIAYGMNDYAFSRAVNVVGGAGAQAQLPAWKQVFVARRLAWAVEDLESTGRSAPLSAVARNAKLRIATIQRHSSQ